MKKLISVLTAVYALTLNVCAVSLEYHSTGELIITSPGENSRVSYYPNISILGACDPTRPLFVNGEEVNVTVNGFFTCYAALETGENTFIITNGDNEEELVITRKEPAAIMPAQIIYYEMTQYAAATADNISRFYDADDDKKMGTPLAKGTVFRLLGEKGDKYIIEDGSYIFKNSAYMLDFTPPGAVIEEYGFNGDTLTFKTNVNVLYDIELSGDKANVILYAPKDNSPNQTFEASLAFEPIGFGVDFADGYMNVEFLRPPENKRSYTVIIDAGHGGNDPGALGPPGVHGPAEKDINLYVAEKVRDYLEMRGVNVIFPRGGDITFPAVERAVLFSEKPDLSVCLHSNSQPLNADYSLSFGPLIYYTLGLSEKTADNFITHVAETLGERYSPPVRQNFLMTRYTGAPSVLLEMGYMSNPENYELLINTDYLEKIAVSVGEAAANYLGVPLDIEIIPPPETTSETTESTTAAAEYSEPEQPLPELAKAFSPELTVSVLASVIALGMIMIAVEPKL